MPLPAWSVVYGFRASRSRWSVVAVSYNMGAPGSGKSCERFRHRDDALDFMANNARTLDCIGPFPPMEVK
jgi:hypothetical protein